MAALDRLLRPSSIAVIGGGSWCANVIEQCRKIGFGGEIWPVHPTKETLGGLPTRPDIASLPAPPDAAFVGVNREATIDIVGALARHGAGGAVCFASGFREAVAETADGAELEAALLDAARDMPILGPNCYGFLNYLDGAALWPDQHGGLRTDRGVALVTQSSNIAINLTMQARGLPLAYVVTVGNQAQTGLSAVASAFLDDPRVTAIGCHIEGIDDLGAFERLAAAAHAAGKPVVVLKVGRSDVARAATISHTASLAGSDAGATALFKRLGMAEVRSLSTFLETLKLLHVAGPVRTGQIASMSCSGGEASLMADMGEAAGLAYPPLTSPQIDALRRVLGPKVALANPLDYHTYIWGDVGAMEGCFTAMMDGPAEAACIVLDLPRADRCSPAAWAPAMEAVTRTRRATGKTMAIVASLPETMPEDVAARLITAGVVPFSGMEDALAALAASTGIGRPDPAPLLRPPAPSTGNLLNEAEAKALLASHGVQIPKGVLCLSVDEVETAAAQLGGRLVIKGLGLAHKTEANAVVLGITSPEAARAAAEAMPCDAFLVEEMIGGALAELLCGVVADPAHGYVLTLGAGGTLTELMDDTASCLLPTSRAALTEMLLSLRSAPLLAGYRSRAAADMDAILDAVMAVAAYVEEARPLEVEINPLIVTANAAVAADALIRTGSQT